MRVTGRLGYVRGKVLGLLVTTLGLAGLATAEPMPVPLDVQVPLLMKIMTFDRNFSTKFRSSVKIGIIFNPSDADSRSTKEELSALLQRLTDKTLRGLPVEYVLLDFVSESAIGAAAEAHGVNIFYVVPGNSDNLDAILSVSRDRGITTVTGVPDYVDKGVAIGIGLTGDRKPRILVNLVSSRSEGCVLDATLLGLATVVQESNGR